MEQKTVEEIKKKISMATDKTVRRLENEMTFRQAVEFVMKLEFSKTCPECGEVLNIDKTKNSPSDISTYIPGLPRTDRYFCEKCGFDVYAGDDRGAYLCPETTEFIIGTHVGGIMEHPDYVWEDVETIFANSRKEAIRKYREIHPQTYWSVVEIERKSSAKQEEDDKLVLGLFLDLMRQHLDRK